MKRCALRTPHELVRKRSIGWRPSAGVRIRPNRRLGLELKVVEQPLGGQLTAKRVALAVVVDQHDGLFFLEPAEAEMSRKHLAIVGEPITAAGSVHERRP